MKFKKEKLFESAMVAAMFTHYNYVTRADIAKDAGCPESLISYYFGTMFQLRQAIVDEAIKSHNWIILGQALAADNPKVKDMRDEIVQHMW